MDMKEEFQGEKKILNDNIIIKPRLDWLLEPQRCPIDPLDLEPFMASDDSCILLARINGNSCPFSKLNRKSGRLSILLGFLNTRQPFFICNLQDILYMSKQFWNLPFPSREEPSDLRTSQN